MRDLPTSHEDILALPPPAKSFLARARDSGLRRAGTHFLEVWLTLLEDYDEIVGNGVARIGDSEVSGNELWIGLCTKVAYYYEFSIVRLFKRNETIRERPPPGINLPSFQSYHAELSGLLDSPTEGSRPFDPPFTCRLLLVGYLSCLTFIFIIWTLRGTPADDHAGQYYRSQLLTRLMAFQAAAFLIQNEEFRRLHDWLIMSVILLMTGLFDYERPGPQWGGARRSLRIGELESVAARSSAAKRRHGEHRLSDVLENQLTLLFQSFGFLVVQARRGERLIDLVCISGDPRAPATVLVEAKSSARPYGLPTRDERAIKEYVSEVRRSLTTLPELALVVVVGATPARALEARLRRLERDTGVPVRFVSASLLVSLSENVLGLTPAMLIPELRSAEGPIVGDSIVVSVVKRLGEQREAHETLVRSLLPSVL